MMGAHEFDVQTKRRKIANRSRSGSCIESFGKPREFDIVHNPEWMQNYPNKVSENC